MAPKMTGPERYVEWINTHLGFNPRSAANSNALSEYIVEDLSRASPKAIKALIKSGHLVPLKNASVSTKVTVRNIDLVLYEKEALPQISVAISVEHKTVMTAHGKARKNRYGDIIAYCNHMHNHRRDCIVGATVVINTSELYENPDAFARGLQRPKFNMDKVVKDTVKIFESIPLRESLDDPNDTPEALAVIVVDYDGVNPARLVTNELSPAADSTAYYPNFIRQLVAKYEARFCR
ncbi:MAG TPA: hypothetical protein VGQ72_07720 [Pyrinomonadaceae bacterium]|jgi:hypothetical protein|nr:hypothetical protein [Pyrinomonadaceae bacterium]